MNNLETDRQDAEVVRMALKALTAAQHRALASGRAVILVVNGELVRITGSSKAVLKKLPARRRVSNRTKRALQ
jgi:hypothetical protein